MPATTRMMAGWMGRVSRTQAKKPSSSRATTAADSLSGSGDVVVEVDMGAHSSQTGRGAGAETMAAIPSW